MSSFDVDPSVRVQDDLFRHVNGHWLAASTIPDDKHANGVFYDLRDASEEAVRDIVTGLSGSEPGSEAAKVEQLYASFMDEAGIEARGLAPLRGFLDEIDAIADVPGLLGYLGRSLRRGTGALLELWVDTHPGDPTRYVVFTQQGGLGLPDEEYYRLPEHAEIRDAYVKHVGRTLALANLDETGAAAVMDLETAIAACHWDKVRTRDLRAMFNPKTVEEFCADLDWRPLLAEAGLPNLTDLIDAQPSFATDVAALLTPERLDGWRTWARWHLISALSPYLPAAFVDERFGFYGTTLQGIPALKARWKRGVALVEDALGEAVGKLYVERHFSPVAKERMDDLVANLVEAYRRSIADLDWMTDATKAEALAKLAKFTPKIGFPAVWKDYAALAVSSDDLVGNRVRATEFAYDDEWSKLGGPIRTYEWLMTPQTVNAYYHPLRNEIVFPAAILQPPFFDEHADDAVNYGAIGAVIGHEIGHGFDDQGSTCDGDGALRDWWTQADREAFEARTGALKQQYSALAPRQLPGTFVNGELTIGENIGDLGGLSIAYLAWRLAVGAEEPEPIDGQTGPQRLFLSWARAWQTKMRDEALKQQIATDPHSPAEFRCNQVVRNVPEFYEAFRVTPDDALWLAPEERVKIW